VAMWIGDRVSGRQNDKVVAGRITPPNPPVKQHGEPIVHSAKDPAFRPRCPRRTRRRSRRGGPFGPWPV